MRFAIFVRVSSQRQAQAQTSLPQLGRLRAYLRAENYQLLDQDVFADDGDSGASLKRPALERLLGRSGAELVGMRLIDLLHSEEQARVEETMDGEEPAIVEHQPWPGQERVEEDSGLWARSRDFDWGD